MTVSLWLWTALALIVLVTLGHGLLAVILRATALYWAERWALSFLLGTGAGTFLWFVLSPVYGFVTPTQVITVIALVAWGASGARGAGLPADLSSEAQSAKEEARSAKAGGARSAAEAALSIILVIECVALLLAALRTPLGWDALFNFEIKARLAMENVTPGRLPLAYLSDVTRTWSHPQYPLVVPFAEFWIYSWLGRIDQSAIKILFPLFYFSLIAIIYGAVRRMTGRTIALACAVGLGLLPPLAVQPGAVSGYADIPLAAAFAGAVSLTILALRTGQPDALWLAAALSAVAAWTKTEGLMLAVALGVSAFFAQWIAVNETSAGIPRKTASALLWFPLLAVAPWLVVQRFYGLPLGDFHPISFAMTASHLHTVPAIVSLMSRELVLPGRWALLWPAFVLSLGIMIGKRCATPTDWLMAAVVSVPLIIYMFVFIYSAWPDVREHIGTSLSRLLVPLAPIALMFAVKQIWSQHSEIAEWV